MGFRHGTVASFALVLALLGAALCGQAEAAPSFAFGTNGRITTGFAGEASGTAIAHDASGRLIVAGTLASAAGNDFALARYRPDGNLDPSFGVGGRVVTDLGGDEQATGVAIDSRGRIVVAGYSGYQYTPAVDQALVARYLPDGSLDPGFGAGGIAPAGAGGALALALDPSDRVLFSGGTSLGPFDHPWRVVRLTTAGAPDPSFGGGDGEVSGHFSSEGSRAEDLALDQAGRIVFAGCGENSEGPPLFTVSRLLADGSPDPGFGQSGLARISLGADYGCATSIAIDHRGRILAAGNGSRGLTTARLLPDGARHRSFSNDGLVGMRFNRASTHLGSVAVDGRNRVILAAGIEPSFRRRGGDTSRFLFVRLRADGRPDRRFGGDGALGFRFGAAKRFDATAADLTLLGGRIFAAGTVDPTQPGPLPSRFALLRYPAQ